MRILLTNNSLVNLAGSENWVATMYHELSINHNVEVMTAVGENRLFPYMMKCRGGFYDVAIVNHNSCLKKVLQEHEVGKIIFTSHGVIPELEQPILGADIYVAVSEEVRNNLKRHGFQSVLIRNPIDTEKFAANRPVNKTLKNILFSSNYQGEVLDIITEAAADYNIEVIGKGNRIANVPEKLNWADLVIGLGRTAYEAMACERNVLVYDYNGGDGLITPSNIYTLRQYNCSGRSYKVRFRVNELKEIFQEYDHAVGPQLRQYIIKNNDSKMICDKYLKLAEYNHLDFQRDLRDQQFSHLKSLNRFTVFYNELGKNDAAKNQKRATWRMNWIETEGEILELGCHAGYNLIYYAKQGFNITGVDISQSLVDEARRRISKQPPQVREKITIIKGFIERLPVDKQYDTILMTELLEHVINPLTILKKARKLLKDDGRIYITVPSEKQGNSSHVRGVSKPYLIGLLTKAQLQIKTWNDELDGLTAGVVKKR